MIRGAVDVFCVADLLHPAVRLAVFGNGEGDVRLQGHEAAVGICEGQKLTGIEKVFVFQVEVVLLKFADLIK